MTKLFFIISVGVVFIISSSSCSKKNDVVATDLTSTMVGTYNGTSTDSVQGSNNYSEALYLYVTKVNDTTIYVNAPGTVTISNFNATLTTSSTGFTLTVIPANGVSGVILPGNVVQGSYTSSSRQLKFSTLVTSGSDPGFKEYVGTH